MYIDELYMGIFVACTVGVARLSAMMDKYIVDGLVNLVAFAVRRFSSLMGLNDQYVVDGAVNGVATATQGLGAAARAPQTGRIRLYVTVALGIVTIGVAAAVALAIWM
jgi:NADH-quinone oxidoreductase subunit L